MISQDPKLISNSPIVSVMIENLLKSVGYARLVPVKREVIHSDLVPKFSQIVVDAKMNTRQSVPPRNPAQVIDEKRIEENIVRPTYGKIIPLLNDPRVTLIECLGPNQPLGIMIMGRKQLTRIVLNASEVKGVLEQAADSAHVPLLDGVFRASVDNFAIKAIVSDVVGSRFIISKNVVGR